METCRPSFEYDCNYNNVTPYVNFKRGKEIDYIFVTSLKYQVTSVVFHTYSMDKITSMYKI
jgi:hypothetical protein